MFRPRFLIRSQYADQEKPVKYTLPAKQIQFRKKQNREFFSAKRDLQLVIFRI